jgi:hypothetical protein
MLHFDNRSRATHEVRVPWAAGSAEPVSDETNQSVRRIGEAANRRITMKKLLVVAIMALAAGLGMSSAFAATASNQSNHPRVVHFGPDYSADAGGGA